MGVYDIYIYELGDSAYHSAVQCPVQCPSAAVNIVLDHQTVLVIAKGSAITLPYTWTCIVHGSINLSIIIAIQQLNK